MMQISRICIHDKSPNTVFSSLLNLLKYYCIILCILCLIYAMDFEYVYFYNIKNDKKEW